MSIDKEYAHDWIENNKKRLIEISDKVWEFANKALGLNVELQACPQLS